MASKLTLVASALTMVSVSTVAMASTPLPFPGEITGNISVISSYNLRGMTNSPESDTPAVQGGIDYSHDSGFYLGYWFSTLTAAYADFNTSPTYEAEGKKSFESDFYAGYNGQISDDWGYQIGGTMYYYYPGWESTGYETMLGLSYKNFSITAQTLLNNVTFGNEGDTYFLATYTSDLPADFTGKFQVGAYYYGDDDEFLAEYPAEAGDATKTDFAFRHATVGVSHPLGNTGATWSMDYIFGGYTRDEVKQKNKVVLGVSYGF